ncbi:unnamed protein product [Pleuronectes platessa]|uniref:Uncharacterized protein n=1 Tax=Pleuronectes platessa TaxID=8262 RepID=A0A9N7Z7K8_PLEPL|nr:unnamed protein product [Pleuronectes platessa]
MAIGSFCKRCCRVCNGGGRSVPRDEGISRNQEVVGLAEGYFLVKRFLNSRGDQRRWLPAPKAVCPDKHPAKCRVQQRVWDQPWSGSLADCLHNEPGRGYTLIEW